MADEQRVQVVPTPTAGSAVVVTRAALPKDTTEHTQIHLRPVHLLKSKTTLMLKQKIPKKYLHLQQIVGEIAAERRADGKDPVLSTKLYSLAILKCMTVMNKMIELTNSVFRDAAELQQATNFLHENGVLFHFTDEHLKDLYFLDPQWLCDQLSKVVTIKDINRYAPNGVMEIAKLPLLFHGFTHNPSNAIKYIVSLLERFEVALPFDEKNIIIPSMLPTELELPACIGLRCDIRSCTSFLHEIAISRGGLFKELAQSNAPMEFEDIYGKLNPSPTRI